jgi:hypothetical protein
VGREIGAERSTRQGDKYPEAPGYSGIRRRQKMIAQLLRQMNQSDMGGVSALIKKEITSGARAWAIHLALFPLAQRVLNLPFINPHLPKMYRIYREFLPYLKENEIPALVRLEITEYTK